MVIPNADLFTNSVTVNTAHDQRRLQYDIRIPYGDNIADAKRILLETMRATDEVLDDPEPTALVVQLDENSIQIRLRWWIAPPHQFDVFHSQDVVLENAITALLENGFDVPFSTRKVLLQLPHHAQGLFGLFLHIGNIKLDFDAAISRFVRRIERGFELA